MKKVLLFIPGIILFLFISVNVASAFSTSIAETIQGLPFGEQLTLLAQRVDENTVKTQQLEQDLNTTKQQLEEEKAKNATLEGKVNQQTTNNETLKKRMDCEELKKKTPANGPYQFIDKDIVGYYQNVYKRLDELNKGITNRPEELESETKFYKDLVSKAKPLYDAYIAECGN